MAEVQSSTNGVLRLPITGRRGDKHVLCGWTTVTDNEVGRQLAEMWWCLDGVGYACQKTPGVGRKGRFRRLHRVIYEACVGPIDPNLTIDHIDRNRLNNCLDNLRLITQSENSANRAKQSNNTSGYVGVIRLKGKWRAQVKKNQKFRSLGEFDCKIEAARRVNEAYRELFPNVTPPNPV